MMTERTICYGLAELAEGAIDAGSEQETVELIGVNFEAITLGFREGELTPAQKKYYDAEIAWFQNGVPDLQSLATFTGGKIPRAWLEHSADDGTVFSNYGARCLNVLDRWDGEIARSQFDAVVDELATPESRRATAVITSWHAHDICQETNDFCCTNAVNFYARGGNLETIVQMRSLDMWYGFVIDLMWWRHMRQGLLSALHERHGISLSPGKIVFQVGSCHIYARHFRSAAAWKKLQEWNNG